MMLYSFPRVISCRCRGIIDVDVGPASDGWGGVVTSLSLVQNICFVVVVHFVKSHGLYERVKPMS